MSEGFEPLWLAVIVHYRAPTSALSRMENLVAANRDIAICIADNSGDFPEPAARSGATVHRFPNLGYGAAVNRCVRRFAGRWDYLFVMTQDLVIDDARFLAAASELLERSDIGVVGPALIQNGDHWSAGGKVDRLGRVSHLGPQDSLRATWVDGAALALSHASWDAVGGFADEYFLYKEDVELGLRLSRLGRSAACLPEISAEQVSSSACHYLETRNRLIFARRNFGRLVCVASLLHVLLRTLRNCSRNPRLAWPFLVDAALGISDARTGLLDLRVLDGAVRKSTMFSSGPARRGRRTRRMADLAA